MASKEKNKSLLEIAVELFHEKHKLGIKKPQPIIQIAKEVMEIKGLKTTVGKELLPQFLADFMESGYFVYCGDGCWDLKEYQPLSVLEKEASDTYSSAEEDQEVKQNELRDDYETEVQTDNTRQSSETEEEEEEEKEKDEFAELLNYEGEEDENALNTNINFEEDEYQTELISQEELDELPDEEE